MSPLIEKAFVEPLRRLAEQFSVILPGVVTVMFILVIGGAVTYLVGRVTRRVLQWIHFDRMLAPTELGSMLQRSGVFRSGSDFAARVVQGFLWLLFVLVALTALDTDVTRDLTVRFVAFVPELITAALVLLLGSLVSQFLGRSALLAAVNAQWPGARLIAGSVRALVMSLAVIMALEQLHIGRTALLVSFAILFAGVVMALAIAFGLGGRDLVREWLRSRSSSETPEKDAFRQL